MNATFIKAYRVILNCSNVKHVDVIRAKASLVAEAEMSGNEVLRFTYVLRDDNLIVHAILRS